MKKTKRYWRILAKRRGKLCDLLQDQVDELELQVELAEGKRNAELGIVPPVPAFTLGDPDWTKLGAQLGDDFKRGIRFSTPGYAKAEREKIAELEATVRAQEQTILTREQENARLERANARWADRAYELTQERDRALDEMRRRPRVGGRAYTVTVQADEQLKRAAELAQRRERAAVEAGRSLQREVDNLRALCKAHDLDPALEPDDEDDDAWAGRQGGGAGSTLLPPRDSIVEPTGDPLVDEMLDAATRPLYAETAGMQPMISHPIKSCGSLFSHPHHVWDAIVGDQAEPHYCEGIAQP